MNMQKPPKINLVGERIMIAKIIVKMPNGKTKEINVSDVDKTVEDLLIENNIAPDSVVVLKNGKPIPVTEKLKDGDTVMAIIAFSGG